MKRIAVILICILLLAGCGKQTAPETTAAPAPTTVPATTQPAEGPEGILEEKQTETVYLLARMTVRSGERPEDWRREYVYDGEGKLAEEFEYTAGHTLTARRSYTYDEAGLLTVQTVEHMSHDDPGKVEMTLVTRYTYGSDGLLTAMEVFENDALSTRVSYLYDDLGRETESVTMPGGVEDIRYITRSTYGEGGLLLAKEDIFEDQLMYRTEYTYDEAGNLLSSRDQDRDGNVTGTMEVTWEGTTKTVVYCDMTGEIYLTEVTTCNESGEPTLSESIYADGGVITTEYTYEPYEIQK